MCENGWRYSWNNRSRNFEVVWEICLIKCDFTAEIQPRKTDSGTEPISVGIVWLKKTRKSYIYHIYYVSERSFYKIHASERLPLNYAFVKSILNFIWSDIICVAIQNANIRQQTEDNSDPWHERKWCHMHVRFTVNHSAALKRFNQTTFAALKYFVAPQILSQYMTSDYLTSCEQKTKIYRFTLVNKHESTMWHFPVTYNLNGVEGIVCCEHRKVHRSYGHEAAVWPFLMADHNFAPFILWSQLVNSYLDDLLCSGYSAVGRSVIFMQQVRFAVADIVLVSQWRIMLQHELLL